MFIRTTKANYPTFPPHQPAGKRGDGLTILLVLLVPKGDVGE